LLPNSNNPINWFKDEWAEWLGEEALAKFGEYRYYSKSIELVNGKKLPAGTRLIAWNTTTTDSLNYNIWGERNDPGHQFAWLEQQLAEVEAVGGLALMIGHYTPNQF